MVTAGTKYVMRTDVIYQRPLPPNPKLNKFADNSPQVSLKDERRKTKKK